MIFEEYNWHDSIVKKITIDRFNPGIKDNISFEIKWPDNHSSILIFENTYWANMQLNFGIIADETILDARIDQNDADLANFYSNWKGLMNDVSLNLYSIQLNSTGGSIKIIAKEFKIIDT